MSEQLAFSRSVTSKPRGPRGKNPKWTSIHPTMSGLAQLSAWKAQNDFSNKWFVRTTNTLKVGYSELLCCKLNRACKAQLKIEVVDDASIINVLSKMIEHDHDDETVPKQPYKLMPSPTKQAVQLGLAMGQTAQQIKDFCLQKEIDTSKVTKTKLNNFVYQETLRRNAGTKQATAMTTGFLRSFAAQHNPDNARYDQGAVYKIELGMDANNPYFFLFITSQKLMDTMAKFGNAHFDATWKCMYSGHPLFYSMLHRHQWKDVGGWYCFGQ